MKRNFFLCQLILFFLISCVDTPTEKKVLKEEIKDIKTERVAFEDKATVKNITLTYSKHNIVNFNNDNTSEHNENFISDLKFSNKKNTKNFIKVNVDLILEVPIYEIKTEYIEKVTQTKKISQYQHNPLGALSSSILMFGTIEAWCLLEWTSNILPGKQKNIYLDECKEFYLGDKKTNTETFSKNKAVTDTGKKERLVKPLNFSKIKFYANNELVHTYFQRNLDKKIPLSDIIFGYLEQKKLESIDRNLIIKMEIETKYKQEIIVESIRFIIPKKVIKYEINRI